MAKRGSICTAPDPPGKNPNLRQFVFPGCVPHRPPSKTAFKPILCEYSATSIRNLSDFPPQTLRFSPARLRFGCGALSGTTLPIRYGPREKTLKKDPKRTKKRPKMRTDTDFRPRRVHAKMWPPILVFPI